MANRDHLLVKFIQVAGDIGIYVVKVLLKVTILSSGRGQIADLK